MKARFKILVPVDFSPTAARSFRFAMRVGTLLQAELHLLHVIYPQMEDIDHPMQSSTVATASKSQLLKEKLTVFVAKEKAKWEKETGVAPPIFIHVEIGGAIAVIKKRARQDAYDLVIMGTRDKHETVEHMLGTVASDVVGNATCPVIVVPHGFESRPIQKIAHAIEPRLVEERDITTIVDRFLPLHREVHLIRFSNLSKNERPQKLLQLQSDLEARFPDIQLEIHHMDKKDLVQDINHFVDETDIDLLIMYRSQGNTWKRLFHRSHTRLMARYTHIPLLVI